MNWHVSACISKCPESEGFLLTEHITDSNVKEAPSALHLDPHDPLWTIKHLQARSTENTQISDDFAVNNLSIACQLTAGN